MYLEQEIHFRQAHKLTEAAETRITDSLTYLYRVAQQPEQLAERDAKRMRGARPFDAWSSRP